MIEIKEIDEGTVGLVNQVDGAFLVETHLRVDAEDGVLKTTPFPVPPYMKKYPYDPIDCQAYLFNADKTIFLAFFDRELAGQILLRINWNRFAYVEDIAVDSRFRRRGVGRLLLEFAICWARERGGPGIILETQNNNVGACQLYEKMGFMLGGFDRYLYRGIFQQPEETALYWYLLF
jgi:streptothricin acetyltransferase